jgi:Flp pilus assembly secretin CpaC
VIIVLQTSEVHQCIEDLLKEMRSFMKIQVAVDLRYLFVGTDFMREVGFRWPHFTADANNQDEVGNIDGFHWQSQSYGGLASWQQPSFSIGLDDEGEPVGFQTGQFWGWGNPLETPDWDFDEDSLTFTFDKVQATGPAFIETGIPFFDSLPGMGLDFGWGGDDWNLSGFFRIGQERDEVKTLAAPRLVLANGQMGSINISTTKDYVDTYDVEDGVLVPQIASISESTLLAVRPIVGPDLRYVFLELAPSISLFDLTDTRSFSTFVGQPGGDGGAAGAEVSNFITLPALASDVLRTTVGVPDRGVLVIGGLARSTRTHKESGVPILSKIPVLKRLFSAEGRQLDRDTTFILACPQIIIIGEEEQRMR